MFEYTEITAIGIITLFLIKEMFAYLKEKQKGKCPDSVQDVKLAQIEVKLESIETLTSNHIEHIQKDIELIRKDIEKICDRLDK